MELAPELKMCNCIRTMGPWPTRRRRSSMLATSYFHERVSLARATLFFLVYLTRPRRQEIQAPSITCFAEDPPSERKAGLVDDDGYRPSSFFLSLFFFFFHSFFFFKVFSLSHIDIERERERERGREGVFASMTIVNSSIDLHRWPRALIIFHGEFGFFFMCAVCFSLEESQRKIRAIKVIWTCDLFSAVKVIDWNKFPNSYWRFNYWTGSFGYVDILLIESCIDTILKF